MNWGLKPGKTSKMNSETLVISTPVPVNLKSRAGANGREAVRSHS